MECSKFSEALAELRKNPALCLKDMVPFAGPGGVAECPPDAAGPMTAHSPHSPHPLNPVVGLQEWFYEIPGSPLVGQYGRDWFAPLIVMSFLAGKNLLSNRRAGIFFIGRRCWPSLPLLNSLMPDGQWRTGCIFIDPPTAALRFWAIDQALRCAAVAAVVADAGECTPVGSRRLQLAAEAGGGYGLLARPTWERRQPSAAQQRWMVKPQLTNENFPRWRLELIRGRGRMDALVQDQVWLAQWRWDKNRHSGLLCVEPG